MKSIPLRHAPIATTAVLLPMLRNPPVGQGFTIEQIRSHLRLIEVLEHGKGAAVLLEDADHAVLARAVQGASWAAADADLLAIIDDVLNAKAPEPTVVQQLSREEIEEMMRRAAAERPSAAEETAKAPSSRPRAGRRRA